MELKEKLHEIEGTLQKNIEEVSDYIRFYNEERLQKNLGNRSPLEYRKFKEKIGFVNIF